MSEAGLPAQGFNYQRQARSPALVVSLISWGIGLVLLWSALKASLVFVVLFALPLAPALWDLWRNPLSGLSITDEALSWHHAGRQETLPLAQIAKLRLDRRWDFSFRATLITSNGQKLRLPQPALPPVAQLESALAERAIPTERHHFTVF